MVPAPRCVTSSTDACDRCQRAVLDCLQREPSPGCVSTWGLRSASFDVGATPFHRASSCLLPRRLEEPCAEKDPRRPGRPRRGHVTECMEWLKAFSAIGTAEGLCPSCGSSRLAAVLVGDPSTRIGGGAVYCQDCMSAVRVSRAGAPAGVRTYASDEDVPSGLLPNDLRFVEPR